MGGRPTARNLWRIQASFSRSSGLCSASIKTKSSPRPATTGIQWVDGLTFIGGEAEAHAVGAGPANLAVVGCA